MENGKKTIKLDRQVDQKKKKKSITSTTKSVAREKRDIFDRCVRFSFIEVMPWPTKNTRLFFYVASCFLSSQNNVFVS